MNTREVSLEKRQDDYRLAEELAITLGERWLDARIKGRVPPSFEREFDRAIHELRIAKRRLEATERRLEKKASRESI